MLTFHFSEQMTNQVGIQQMWTLDFSLFMSLVLLVFDNQTYLFLRQLLVYRIQ